MARQEREKRYIAEYMMATFEVGTYALNQPLGEIPEELVRMHGLTRATLLSRPQRRRVDAVAWSPDAYYLIEAKIRDPLEGLGRLVVYRDEATRTSDLPGFSEQPFIPRLVVPFTIKRDRDAAFAQDIELVEFLPPWVADYVRERQLYHTAEFRQRREERDNLRRALGVE